MRKIKIPTIIKRMLMKELKKTKKRRKKRRKKKKKKKEKKKNNEEYCLQSESSIVKENTNDEEVKETQQLDTVETKLAEMSSSEEDDPAFKTRKERNRLKLKKRQKKYKKPPVKNMIALVNRREVSLEYLQTWYVDRSHWKFQKLNQIWLLQHAYSQKKVPKYFFNIFLKYIIALKGKSRETTIDEAQVIVQKYEAEQEVLKEKDNKEKKDQEEKET